LDDDEEGVAKYGGKYFVLENPAGEIGGKRRMDVQILTESHFASIGFPSTAGPI